MNWTGKHIGFLLAVALLLLGFSFSTAKAQAPIAATTRPFEPKEELYYEAQFSRSLLRGLDVAEFKLRSTRTPASPNTDPKSSPSSLVFNAEVSSKGFFTRLFNLKFRERIESTVDPNTFTILKTTILDEQGKRVRSTETTYDRSSAKMSWTQRDPNNPAAEPRQAVAEFDGQLQDVLSAIYYIRTQPLQVGKSFEVFIGESGRVFRVPFHVVERKKIKTVLGRVHALRVEPELFGPDRLIHAENGQFSIWVTEDSRHIPVSARVKTDYGTFDIKLKSFSVSDKL